MNIKEKFNHIPTTAYAEVLTRSNFMDYGIKALWQGMPRMSGPAFTVQLAAPGDNLMLHSAIHEAPAGSVIVVDALASEFSVAGGNVCAVAKKRGVVGFVIDGVIRDIGEVRDMRFPVFARGVVPVPGYLGTTTPINPQIRCGGAAVNHGDIVVADEDGVIVLPAEKADSAFEVASNRVNREAKITLDDWEIDHLKKVKRAMQESK